MRSRLLAAVTALVAAAAIFLEGRAAVDAFASSPMGVDAPAHYTTGVMVYDYLRLAAGSSPVHFAEAYYVRFPKVAFGHWPPAYYAIQAAWYFLFGPHIWSAVLLSAVTALALAVLLFFRLKTHQGTAVALGCSAAFLVLPEMQTAAWSVMSDLLTGLFVFLAIFAFSDFLQQPRSRSAAIRFAAWSVLAILTKGIAWALGPFAVLAPLIGGRTACFRSPYYWASGALIVAGGAPFYLLTRNSGIGYPADYSRLTSSAVRWTTRLFPLAELITVAGPLILTAGIIAFLYALQSRWMRDDRGPAATDAIVAGSWLAAQCLFQILLPMTSNSRVFLPCVAPAVFLFGHLLGAVRVGLRRSEVWAAAVPGLLLILCLNGAWAAGLPVVKGYGTATGSIPYDPDGTLMLAASTGYGEGAFVAERLARDPARAGALLLASHVFAESSWSGRRYRLLAADAAEVIRPLSELPVRYILIDDLPPVQPHRKLLEDAVRSRPDEFALLGRYPLTGYRGRVLGEVRVYENLLAGGRRPAVLRARLGLDRGGRVLEYPAGPLARAQRIPGGGSPGAEGSKSD